MEPGPHGSGDPREVYANWKAGKPDPIQPKQDTPAIAGDNQANGLETSPVNKERTDGNLTQLTEQQLTAEPSVSNELLGVERIPEFFDIREKIGKAKESVRRMQGMSDEDIENEIEERDLMTRDGELLTVEQYRQRTVDSLAKLQREEEGFLDTYRELLPVVRTIAHTYAEQIPIEERAPLSERGEKEVRGYLNRVGNIQTHGELFYLLGASNAWNGSTQEVADKLETMASGLADRPQDFNIQGSQFGRMTDGLPSSVQKAMLGILVHEGDMSMGRELRLLAERIRQNPDKQPSELYGQRSEEVLRRPIKAQLDRQQWLQTEAIQYLLREIYPELINQSGLE